MEPIRTIRPLFDHQGRKPGWLFYVGLLDRTARALRIRRVRTRVRRRGGAFRMTVWRSGSPRQERRVPWEPVPLDLSALGREQAGVLAFLLEALPALDGGESDEVLPPAGRQFARGGLILSALLIELGRRGYSYRAKRAQILLALGAGVAMAALSILAISLLGFRSDVGGQVAAALTACMGTGLANRVLRGPTALLPLRGPGGEAPDLRAEWRGGRLDLSLDGEGGPRRAAADVSALSVPELVEQAPDVARELAEHLVPEVSPRGRSAP